MAVRRWNIEIEVCLLVFRWFWSALHYLMMFWR